MEHSAVRVADVDGDGKDEVIGPNFLSSEGQRINGWDLAQYQGTYLGGLDSLSVGDIVHMSDLKLPAGVEIPELKLGKEHDHAVVAAQEIKVEVEAAAAEGEAAPVPTTVPASAQKAPVTAAAPAKDEKKKK